MLAVKGPGEDLRAERHILSHVQTYKVTHWKLQLTTILLIKLAITELSNQIMNRTISQRLLLSYKLPWVCTRHVLASGKYNKHGDFIQEYLLMYFAADSWHKYKMYHDFVLLQVRQARRDTWIAN